MTELTRKSLHSHIKFKFHLSQQQMYGQQQNQQQVQPNQPMLGNTMGPTRMILQGNRMAVPQTGMMNSGMQQQQPQQPVSKIVNILYLILVHVLLLNKSKRSFQIDLLIWIWICSIVLTANTSTAATTKSTSYYERRPTNDWKCTTRQSTAAVTRTRWTERSTAKTTAGKFASMLTFFHKFVQQNQS